MLVSLSSFCFIPQGLFSREVKGDSFQSIYFKINIIPTKRPKTSIPFDHIKYHDDSLLLFGGSDRQWAWSQELVERMALGKSFIQNNTTEFNYRIQVNIPKNDL